MTHKVDKAKLVTKEWAGMSMKEVREWIDNNKSCYLWGTLSKDSWQEVWELPDNIKVEESPQIIFVNSPDHIDIIIYYLFDGIPTSYYLCSSNKFTHPQISPTSGSLFPLMPAIMNVGADYDSVFSIYYLYKGNNRFFLNWKENPLEGK